MALPEAGYAENMSGAAAAVPPPGPRSGTWRTAELLCALSYGSGLAAAERMEHGTNTAFVGIQLGRALGLGRDGLEAVFYGALLKDVGCGACGAVLARFFADDEMDSPARPEPGRHCTAPQHGRLGHEPAAAGSQPARPARPAGRLRLPVRLGGARGDGGTL